MQRFLTLLKTNTKVRNLLFIQLICDFAAWFIHVAVYSMLIDLDAPVWAITFAAALSFLSGVVLAPFTGAIVDRVPTKPMLLAILIIQIITASILMLFKSLSFLWILFFILFIRMSASVIYFQAVMSLFPKLLNKRDLKTANEINSMIWSFGYTFGMASAGVCVHFLGVNISIAINILFYAIAIFVLIKIQIADMVVRSSKKFLLTLKEGVLYLKRKKLLIHLMILHASVGLTSYDALVALLAKFNYPTILSAALVIGLINISRGLAILIGTFCLSSFVTQKTLFAFFIAECIGIIFWALMQFDFYLGLFGTFISGLCTSVLWSFTYTLLQNNTSKKFYGRVVAYNDMIFFTASTATSFAIGFLFDISISLKWITILIGLGFALAGFYFLWIQKKYEGILKADMN